MAENRTRNHTRRTWEGETARRNAFTRNEFWGNARTIE